MSLSVWMYPWGELSERPQAVLQQLRALGVSEIRVAVAYHPISYPDPLTPRRQVVKPSDAVYVPWDGPASITPVVDPLASQQPDWLPRLVEEAHQASILVTAWLVLLRNETLASRYPEMAIISATGASLSGGLCFNRPATRAYALALVSTCAQVGVDQIVLESAGLAPFYGLALPAGNDWARFLRGLCFCPSCQALMTERALDAEALRVTVVEGLGQPYRNLDDRDAQIWLEERGLGDLRAMRDEATGQFWSQLTREAHRLGLQLGVTGRWPETLVEGYQAANLNGVDYFTHLWYNADLARDVEAFIQLRAIVTSRLEVGIRVPDQREALEHFQIALRHCAVNTVVAYNLSRIPLDRWTWLKDLIVIS